MNRNKSTKIGGSEISATAADINKSASITSSSDDINKLDGLQVTSTELELLNNAVPGTVVLENL